MPAGYLADGGLVFAARGNGQTYGWNADNTAQTRDRNAANSADQRYDTLTHLQKPANPDAVWEIAVPNGTYVVRVVSGDASNFDSVFRTTVEGVLTVTGTPTTTTRWIEGTSTVTVTDGRLTIRSGAGASQQQDLFCGDNTVVSRQSAVGSSASRQSPVGSPSRQSESAVRIVSRS